MSDTVIGHYQIGQKLGSGGMGEVYLAEDTRLHRRVALKLLPAEFIGDTQRKSRFLHEAHAASVLNHPNVSVIYEVGETDQTIFIAMEYIEGRTLAQIRESRALETDEVIDIAIQAADALDEARALGIVHRDIKSANMMLTPRGHLKVLDFGLAKMSLEDSAQDEDTRIKTTPGMVLGTCYYMSPEQALGRTVDHRSDLFSLGVVLYELVTGRLPFVGPTTTETIERITHAQPDPIARFNYSLPPELERIIRKLLEKDPERRYQAARELEVDLKNLKRDSSSGEIRAAQQPRSKTPRRSLWAAAAVAVAIVAVAATSLLWNRPKATSSGAIDSIAVLPFVNVSKDAETEYLSDGISESIINNLTQISSLRVIPRSTVFRYKGKELDVQTIAQELNVRAIVSGRVQQRGERLSVQTELVDTQTHAQLWGERYERNVSDALVLQEEISKKISDTLRLRLAEGELQRIEKRTTANPEAYQLYLKGRYHWNKRTADSLRRALAYFEEAVVKDPDFALAHVGIADSHLLMEQYADSPSAEVRRKSEAAALRALALDSNLAEAHATLGLVYDNQWEWERAGAEYRKAIELNPHYPTAYHWYNIHLRSLGKTEEALVQIRKAQQLDPLSMIIGVNVVDVLEILGRYDEAAGTAQKYLEIDPEFPQMLGIVSRLYSRLGRHAESIAAAEKAVRNSGQVSEALATLGSAHARAGHRSAALEIARTIEERVAQEKAHPFHVAAIYAALDDRDRAFAWLNKGVASPNSFLGGIKTDPRMESLRSDPRFALLLRKIGLPA